MKRRNPLWITFLILMATLMVGECSVSSYAIRSVENCSSFSVGRATMVSWSKLPVLIPVPSALPPSEAELEAWHALSREEQLARYREALQNSGRKRVIGTSMAIILTEARRRVAARREI
jgi:hypothetical protein